MLWNVQQTSEGFWYLFLKELAKKIKVTGDMWIKIKCEKKTWSVWWRFERQANGSYRIQIFSILKILLEINDLPYRNISLPVKKSQVKSEVLAKFDKTRVKCSSKLPSFSNGIVYLR